MSDLGTNKPPPIGEALTAGWNAVKPNIVPMALGALCAYIAGIVFVQVPGFLTIAKKALRGEKPEPADGFAGFTNFVDNLVMGLLIISGSLACGIGALVTVPLFMPGVYFMMEEHLTWQQAMNKCLAVVKPNLVPWLVFHLVVLIVGGLGAIACFVGVFVTMPIGFTACFYAYQHAFKTAEVIADGAPPVEEQPAI